MNWNPRIDGWSTRTVVGSIAGVIAVALATLATSAVREMSQAIRDTHDNVLVLRSEVDTLKRAGPSSEAAPLMVEHRLMQFIERNEAQTLRLEQRVLSIEKEHAEYKRQQKDRK